MKMNKTWMITASCIVATSLMAGSAFAKSENGNNADKLGYVQSRQ